MKMLQLLRLGLAFFAMSVLFSMEPVAGDIVSVERQLRVAKVGESSKTIVLIGASYAGGWKPQQPVAGYQIVNKGVNGQQTFEMLARFETDVVALKPDAVIIWGFINDIFRSDPAKMDQTLKRARESVQEMVATAKRSGITPILATEVTIRGKDGWKETIGELVGNMMWKTSYQDYVNGHVRATNRWIRDLAAREKIQLLDFETVLVDQQGVRRKELSKPDGSHISSQGYEALSRYADIHLKALSVSH